MNKINPLKRKNKIKASIENNAPVKKNMTYSVKITDISSDGSGVAKVDGFTVFIPNCALGDELSIKIVKILKNYAFGIIQTITKPSPDRCENDCSVYNQCGGCCYRHINYESELRIKQNQVEAVFNRIGDIKIVPQNIMGSERVDLYRNKGQFPVGKDKDGNIISGFYANHSHRIVACDDCKLQPIVFNQIVNAVTEYCKIAKVSIYDEENHAGLLRHIYLREADFTKELMLCLVLSKADFPKRDDFVEYITEKFPQITSIVLNVNHDKTNVIMGKDCVTIHGTDVITDVLCGNKIEISPLSFYQVNKKQAERLYKQATDMANLTKDDILLDLYCGAGTIGLSVASEVKQLIGVEIIPEAIENANKNARLNRVENAEFICGDCKSAVIKLREEGLKPNVIIVDPPRKGCDSEVINAIVDFAPERLVMISCNPATASRDCKLLEEKGFVVNSYMPVDLFPRTKHCEVIVSLSKKDV